MFAHTRAILPNFSPMKRLRSEDDKHKEHTYRLEVAHETLESKLKQELELKAKGQHDR